MEILRESADRVCDDEWEINRAALYIFHIQILKLRYVFEAPKTTCARRAVGLPTHYVAPSVPPISLSRMVELSSSVVSLIGPMWANRGGRDVP